MFYNIINKVGFPIIKAKLVFILLNKRVQFGQFIFVHVHNVHNLLTHEHLQQFNVKASRSSFCTTYFPLFQYHIYVLLCCSYLAEAPYACKEKTGNLLEFIFSIEGQDESRLLLLYFVLTRCIYTSSFMMQNIDGIEFYSCNSPFYSICFMLPMLSQITMEVDGCKTLASFGGYKAVSRIVSFSTF